jgi:uncharacterized protein
MKSNVKSRVFGVVGGTLLVISASLTGCSVERTANAADATQVSINMNSQQGIAINGQGKVTVAPDIATVYLGVSAQAAKVADAQGQATAAMEKLMTSLTGAGIDKKDIQTQSYSIQQISKPTIISGSVAVPPGKVPMPVLPPTSVPVTTESVYQVSNMVVVKIRAIEKTGPILDSVTAAGGDLIRVNSVNFSVDQPDKYYTQARALAMADAKTKAAQLASLAGVTLGKAAFVSENFYSPSTPYPMAAYRDAAGAGYSTPISPGQTDIILSIQVNYAIQ